MCLNTKKMEPKPTHKEEVLTTLKETLLNALSTIERLQCEENVVLDRNTNPKEIDSWCIRCTDKNYDLVNAWFYGCERKCNIGYYYGIRSDNGAKDWLPFFGDKVFHFLLNDEMFYSKTGYPKPEENILHKGNDALISQSGNKMEFNSHYTFGTKEFNNPPKEKKEVLFTTEDGVEVHKGDLIWYLHKDSLVITNWLCYSVPKPLDGEFIYFSTKDAIKEYILMNKPLLSLNDFIEIKNSEHPEQAIVRLKKLAEFKLNNK